jgi:selenium-binding protein 1
MLNGKKNGHYDALSVVDIDPESSGYGHVVGQVICRTRATNCIISAGTHAAPAYAGTLCPHVERRYLVVPGIHSSRIHIIDTKPDPRNPKIVKVIEPEMAAVRAGYASPHTVHCGPEGIPVSALDAPDGGGPGGFFVMDHESFDMPGAVGTGSRPC